MRIMKIRDPNLRNIKDIQEVIKMEEGKEVTFEETLDRVLRFDKKYVPYN